MPVGDPDQKSMPHHRGEERLSAAFNERVRRASRLLAERRADAARYRDKHMNSNNIPVYWGGSKNSEFYHVRRPHAYQR
jgi:hypothetical protein